MQQEPRDLLLKYWGHARFRPLQEEIIQSVISGTDTLALLPTGGGKSVCFQIPALALEGICLVISPLIALMKDQVEQLRKRGIFADAVYSGQTLAETDLIFDNCIQGHTRLLYLSPERLVSENVRNRISRMKLSFIAVDEAHCISQWGYDFRPSYLRIAEIRDQHPGVPIAAFTATATPATRDDIIRQLGFKEHKVFTGSFQRANLSYLVYHSDDKNKRICEILSRVKGSAVVYARSRKGTSDISRMLNANGIAADFYHAGLTMALRNKKQDDWIQNRSRVMVATNAFGMGIDKPDVRIVVHADVPDSLEAYYQEAGRAGRDGKKSFAVLLYQQSDIRELEQRPETSFPPINEIRKVYTAVSNFLGVPVGAGAGSSYDFELTRFLPASELKPLPALACLRVLESEGLIEMSDSVYMPSRIHFPGNQEDLYRFRVESARFDPLIKAILRSTEGAFERFVTISEGDLARKTGIKTDETVKSLTYLDKLGVLQYAPRKDAPQLTYVIPRIPSESIEFDFKAYQNRKLQFKSRIQSVIDYALHTDQCRSVLLLSYFGETAETRCGTCDYCRNRNKLGLNEFEFQRFTGLVKESIENGETDLARLAEPFSGKDKEKILETVQWLLDNEQLKLSADGKLQFE